MNAGDLSISIRVAGVSDAVCIALLGTQVFLDTYATDGIRASLAREAHETLCPAAVEVLLADGTSTFLAAEANGHLLAFAQLSAGAQHPLVACTSPFELKRLYVQERFTRRGLGKSLLRDAETFARMAGATAMWLTAWAGNARALAFYASQGYAQVAAVPFTAQGEEYENRVFAKHLRVEHAWPAPCVDAPRGTGERIQAST